MHIYNWAILCHVIDRLIDDLFHKYFEIEIMLSARQISFVPAIESLDYITIPSRQSY